MATAIDDLRTSSSISAGRYSTVASGRHFQAEEYQPDEFSYELRFFHNFQKVFRFLLCQAPGGSALGRPASGKLASGDSASGEPVSIDGLEQMPEGLVHYLLKDL